ncbi:hypothetical protein F4806DRAFT_364931 [Annulohypoxylon nitens]|nr:hypothetical protein F4806DRAFT_364931 [Annulohypoxylon nitens]
MEANFGIQQAARKVAEENRKIRNLLYTVGFDDEKITFFLQTGNIDANDATIPISARDQGNVDRLLDLLQRNETAMFEYELPSNDTSFPSKLGNIQYDGARCNIASPSIRQSQPTIRATGTNEHIQSPNSVMMNNDTLTCEDQELLQNAGPSIPPSYPIVRHPQHATGLAGPPDGSQLLEPVRYVYDVNLQDPTYCGLTATKKPQAGNEPTVDLYSILSPIAGNDSSPASPEGTYQNSQCQNCMQPGCFPNGRYMNGIVGVGDNLSFSPDMANYLT